MKGRPQTATPSRRIEELSRPKKTQKPSQQLVHPSTVLSPTYQREVEQKKLYIRPSTAYATHRQQSTLYQQEPPQVLSRQEYKPSQPHKPQEQLHDENLGIYKFTNDTTVYCFSDIESNMPDEIKDLMFSPSGNIEYTPLNLTAANKAIVFTGDLIDRGAYTVRNLLNMLKLKKGNAENVILICGNRDINKIRMYHECYIEDIDEMILKKGNGLEKIEDIIMVLEQIEDDDIFENSGCEISASINIQGIVNPHDVYKKLKTTNTVPLKYRKKYDKNFKLSYHDDISRIRDIYTKTLGALNQIKFFRDEFNVLFGNGIDLFGFNEDDLHEKDKDQFKDGIDNDPRYILLLKFIAMMNMVMGKNRKSNDLANLPKCLQPYNGLYINYLEKCHIISKFTIGDNADNIYIASHSGIPYKAATAASTGFFYIPSDVGIEPTSPPTEDNHIDHIENINNNFNGFIKRILNDEVKYTDDEFKKYVAMGASCLDTTISNLTSLASPIVSSLGIDKIRNESLNSLDTLNIAGAKKIYNIFGHQPSGFTPQINRDGDGGSGDVLTSYHIDLDVSKAENGSGISNKKSFVYLTLNNNDNNMLVGKVETGLDNYNLTIEEKTSDNLKLAKGQKDIGSNFSYNIPLDEYCETKIMKNIEYDNGKYKGTPAHIFLVNGYYYGMFGWDLIKLKENLLDRPTGGAGKKKIYTKSVKRFMNGKRQMVIYLGKRGGEYIKVKGEYISLAKYIKTVNKKK